MKIRARRKDQEKGVFCLETDHWYDAKDRSSVEPILGLLERLDDYEVPYLHKRVATRRELEHSLERYLKPRFKTHPILYLAFHGYSKSGGQQTGLHLHDGELEVSELADMMADRCANRIIYFGSCRTMDCDRRRLQAFLQRTGAIAMCGYMEGVDWLESTAFDLLFLGKIQDETLRRRDSMESFDELMNLTAPGLYKDLGFRMIVRDD